MLQKGISETSNEDNELGEDPNLLPSSVDGEEGPLNGLYQFFFLLSSYLL